MTSPYFYSDEKNQIIYPVRKCTNMADLRDDIDKLDRTIVNLLAIRQGFMEQAAHIKQDRNLVRDEKRIEDVVAKVKQHAEEAGAHPELVENLYRDMIEWCITYELSVFDAQNITND